MGELFLFNIKQPGDSAFAPLSYDIPVNRVGQCFAPKLNYLFRGVAEVNLWLSNKLNVPTPDWVPPAIPSIEFIVLQEPHVTELAQTRVNTGLKYFVVTALTCCNKHACNKSRGNCESGNKTIRLFHSCQNVTKYHELLLPVLTVQSKAHKK